MRIDVADPGSERLSIVAALVGAGYDVATAELRDVVETRADLLVLAADAPGALAVLRRLRDDGRRPDVPVILLGTPEGTTPIPEGPGFGAELVLARPVDEDRLLAGVERLVRARGHQRSGTEARGLADRGLGGRGPSERPPGVPEHTLELRERDDPSGVSAILPAPPGPSSNDASVSEIEERPVTRPERKSSPSLRPSKPPTTGSHSQVERRSEAPVSVITTGSGSVSSSLSSSAEIAAPAPISEQLRNILIAADRRVFPGLAAIDVSIPAGEASARELVPDELFDDASPDSDAEDEGLFVVTPLASVLGRSVSSAPPRKTPPSEPPAEPEKNDKKTSPGTPLSLGAGIKAPSLPPTRLDPPAPPPLLDEEALGPADASGVRRLPIAAGVMLRALASIVSSRTSIRAAVRAEGLTIELVFARGELARVEGPVATAALARLGRSAADEAAAKARLAGLVERGELASVSEGLALARAEQDLLARVVALREGEAVFHPARDEDLPTRLGSTGRALGRVAAALEPSEAFALALAPLGANGRLEPTRALGGAVATFGIAPDLGRFFEAAPEGISRLELARATRIASELPGVAALLTTARALVLVRGRPERDEADVRAVGELVREHAARADDADYFTLLGLPGDADDAAVASAYAGRRAQLASLPLDELGLGALGPQRAIALAALDEAHEVLANSALRAAYARALGFPSTGPQA
ncbi:MAG: hypothetical protein U0234_21480 [Sandaracinus sp.]